MEEILINVRQQNDIHQQNLDEINCAIDSINHLESILINKIKYRRKEMCAIRKEYESAIQAYSNIILKLVKPMR
jgi:hypothetical protein